ncbi:MAG: hypothetical protein WC732_08760 [Candidatus Omnitrophota bacterium]
MKNMKLDIVFCICACLIAVSFSCMAWFALVHPGALADRGRTDAVAKVLAGAAGMITIAVDVVIGSAVLYTVAEFAMKPH